MIRILKKEEIAGAKAEGRGPLLVRYVLFDSKWFGVFLHHLMRSDHDRSYHDHPWPFVSFLLTGSYVEHAPLSQWLARRQLNIGIDPNDGDIPQVRIRWSVLFRPARWLHWLWMPAPVWTLVIHGPVQRHWGFATQAGWCRHQDYDVVTAECQPGTIQEAP